MKSRPLLLLTYQKWPNDVKMRSKWEKTSRHQILGCPGAGPKIPTFPLLPPICSSVYISSEGIIKPNDLLWGTQVKRTVDLCTHLNKGGSGKPCGICKVRFIIWKLVYGHSTVNKHVHGLDISEFQKNTFMHKYFHIDRDVIKFHTKMSRNIGIWKICMKYCYFGKKVGNDANVTFCYMCIHKNKNNDVFWLFP